MHRVAAVVEGGGLPPHGGVAVEVLQGDDPPAALHLRCDEGGGLAAIEVVRALVAKPGEDLGEVGLGEGVADRGDRVAGQEDLRARSEGADAVLRGLQGGDEPARHLEALRQVDRGLHHPRPREAPEALVRVPEPLHGSGHARRQMPQHRPVGDVAVLV